MILSHMLKNEQSGHDVSLQNKTTHPHPPKKSLYYLLASIPYDSSPNANDDSAHNVAKTDKMAYIIMMIKCLLIIHPMLLDQPITH